MATLSKLEMLVVGIEPMTFQTQADSAHRNSTSIVPCYEQKLLSDQVVPTPPVL